VSREPALVGYVRQRRNEWSITYLAIEELKLLAPRFSREVPGRRIPTVRLHSYIAGERLIGKTQLLPRGKTDEDWIGSYLSRFRACSARIH
jgi:hypothetical protein